MVFVSLLTVLQENGSAAHKGVMRKKMNDTNPKAMGKNTPCFCRKYSSPESSPPGDKYLIVQ